MVDRPAICDAFEAAPRYLEAMSETKGRVLIIAGSDSGGGAGIQADIKTVTMLGGYAATAITAVTVQNTLGVSGVHPIPLEVIEAQARAVLDDIGADAIKTGMLGDIGTVETVARILDSTPAPAVVDPVMVAKGGAPLLPRDAVGALIAELLPRAALLTPNVPEAEVLSGRPLRSVEELEEVASRLLLLGPSAVLLKGGHLPGALVTDVLVTADGSVHRFESPRIETRSTHGTGCTLASAVAVGIAEGLTLADAVTRARAYVRRALETAPGFGKGHGPLNHAHPVQTPAQTFEA